MILAIEQLTRCLPHAGIVRAARYLPALNAAMAEAEINTPLRIAAFLAQIGHESASFLYVEELASGEAYEGRADLGNVEEGDGVRFKGRGLIQVTGRSNYLACSLALFGDDRLIHFPELLEDPKNACRSAAWFWKEHGLNELADAGNFRRITRIINGGYTHYDRRLALYNTAKEVLL